MKLPVLPQKNSWNMRDDDGTDDIWKIIYCRNFEQDTSSIKLV